MQIKGLLEPSILFISEEEWRNIEKRDAFLEHFLKHLEIISGYSITQIYWTDELEELLINHAYSPPWVSDPNWSNQFFPILYKKFHSLKLIIDSLNWNACQSDPIISCPHINVEILERFLGIVHFLIDKDEKVYFCIGFDKTTDCSTYRFFCNCHDNHLEPIVVSSPNDWFNYIDVLSVCWPQNIQDAFKLRVAIEVVLKNKLFKQIIDLRYNNYELSESFIKDISKETKYRDHILYSLAKRLILTQGEAVSDEGLSDKPVRGKKGERRFRVSGVCRIHYRYSQTGDLVLLNYYGEGQHDKGLK